MGKYGKTSSVKKRVPYKISKAEIALPTSLAGEMKKNDKRQKEWKQQRKERGYDSTELWCLGSTFAKFALPRLVAFKRCSLGHPAELNVKTWDALLDKMIRAFTLILRNKGDRMWTAEETVEVNEGLNAFRDYYLSLWS